MATAGKLGLEIFLITLLNILLPTGDVYSDLALIIKFLTNGHHGWAAILLVPFLLNYVLSWTLWWRLDKNKRFSWVAALLGCYPQWYAATVIRMIWKDFDRGMEKKKKMDRNISEYEVFLESVLSVLGMTYIFVAALNPKDSKLVIGEGSTDIILFLVAYSTSVVTASLGLSKCLKIGPCRVLGEGGSLGGLCSGRFLLLMLSVGVTLVSKGLVLAFTTGHIYGAIVEGAMLVIFTMFLPGLLLALTSVCHFKKSFKTVLSHPSLLLMPVFTHFTFKANWRYCTGEEDKANFNKEEEKANMNKEEEETSCINREEEKSNINKEEEKVNINEEENAANDTRITFSKKWTLINVAVSSLGHVVYAIGINMMQDNCFPNSSYSNYGPCILGMYLIVCLPLAILDILSTLLFLFLDSCRSCCCCCSCCCIPDYQKAVLRVNDPLTEYVMDGDTRELLTYRDWARNRDGMELVG